ncbi:hypothetical protein FBU59_006344 [Linderina macrospora]|uniref:Uncharacterized protein n=1 Tax=Linderina macrospora TaxID=4868 RepID=A0ACC1J080_9FUNG|nr:hypothetical protein FBU59_006344 [Linderina macrospora]
MHPQTIFVVAVLFLLSFFGTARAGYCRAQHILEACLAQQTRQFKMCEYDNWSCKCSSQKKILTCYDNCPDSESRTTQEMQVQIFCGAARGKDYNENLLEHLTKPAKAGVELPATTSAQPATPVPPPKPTPKTADDDDDMMNGFGGLTPGKGIRGKGPNGNGGVMLVNENGVAKQAIVGAHVAAVGVAAMALAI